MFDQEGQYVFVQLEISKVVMSRLSILPNVRLPLESSYSTSHLSFNELVCLGSLLILLNSYTSQGKILKEWIMSKATRRHNRAFGEMRETLELRLPQNEVCFGFILLNRFCLFCMLHLLQRNGPGATSQWGGPHPAKAHVWKPQTSTSLGLGTNHLLSDFSRILLVNLSFPLFTHSVEKSRQLISVQAQETDTNEVSQLQCSGCCGFQCVC